MGEGGMGKHWLGKTSPLAPSFPIFKTKELTH